MVEVPRDRMLPAIIGIGSAVGKNIVTTDQLIPRVVSANPKRTGREAVLKRGVERSIGIYTRNQVTIGEEATTELAVEAGRNALQKAGVEPDQIGEVIIATSSPNYLGDPTAPSVQDQLGIPKNVWAYDVSAACPGWVMAMRLAFMNASHPRWDGKKLLVEGVETISPFTDPIDEDAYFLFGDAGGAVIVDLVQADEGAPTKWVFVPYSDGANWDAIKVEAGGTMNPATLKTVRKRLHRLTLDGPRVKETAIREMTALGKQVLEKTGYPVEEVILVPHQANKGIMGPVADNLGIPRERVASSIDHMGNTSSASIPTAMEKAIDSGLITRNKLVLVVTLGAGVTGGAALLPMVGLPKGEKAVFQGVTI